MRWQTLLEEYDVTFVHVKGVDNVVVDGISLLDADWQNDDD
jgi:2,3-bisphosphoglycerate-independent phosphoglycerate mutase